LSSIATKPKAEQVTISQMQVLSSLEYDYRLMDGWK